MMEDYGYSLPSESVFYGVPVHINHSNNNSNNFINQNNENINRNNYNNNYHQPNREQKHDDTLDKIDNNYTTKFNNINHAQSDSSSDYNATKQPTRDFASNVISIPFKGESTALSPRYCFIN